MHSAKDLKQFARDLNVLYVEDDERLRTETAKLFELFFNQIVLAEDGLAGLQKYNEQSFDLVLTDVNMPVMNGIEMTQKIKEINAEQKIMAISAHNESDILINLIKAGINGFVLKPVIHQEVIDSLYPICRDAASQKLNIKLMDELQTKKELLEKQNRELKTQLNTIDTKHHQVEVLLAERTESKKGDSYFSKDEDEGEQNVVLFSDHCADLLEIFEQIPQNISDYEMHPEQDTIFHIADDLAKASAILFHYSPYLDSLSVSLNELSVTIKENVQAVQNIFKSDVDSILMLFDAVSSDMERYVKRFQVESLAMRNAHHIHEPTALSIRQIIEIIVPNEEVVGEIDFF